MKAIVFGSTGFIGSHVVEQLAIAGHDVTAVVRAASNTKFLQSSNIPIAEADFNDSNTIAQVIDGHDIVYNCTANPKFHQSLEGHREVEVHLTRKIIDGAVKAKAKRFIQLSTIKVLAPSEIFQKTLIKPPFNRSVSYQNILAI